MAETASFTLSPENQQLENFALDSLRQHLQRVTDARAEHGKIHKLLPVLCLVVLGLLTGRTSLSLILALAIGAGVAKSSGRWPASSRRPPGSTASAYSGAAGPPRPA